MIIMDNINSKDLLKVLKYLKDWERENCNKDEPKEELKKKIKPQYTKAVKSKVKRTALTPPWDKIRNDILLRDESRCRICSKDYSLHVHHIDYNRSNNAHSNLVTLCEWCHRGVHREGYKPCNYPDYPAPWDSVAEDVDEFNQEYNW